MKHNALILMLLTLTSTLLFSSCVGLVKVDLTAKNVPVPVSFTSSVYDESGNILTPRPNDLLNHFTIKRTHWSMFWSTVNLTNNKYDLSPDLNAKVKEFDGDAIINLTVKYQSDFWGFFQPLIAIIPDAQFIKVEGDVIKYAKYNKK